MPSHATAGGTPNRTSIVPNASTHAATSSNWVRCGPRSSLPHTAMSAATDRSRTGKYSPPSGWRVAWSSAKNTSWNVEAVG